MIYGDLQEVKRVLDIDLDDNTENWKILLYLEWVTDFLKEVTSRDFEFKTRVEYYCGTGTQKLLLNQRPVYPAPTAPGFSSIQVVYDSSGYFGAASNAFADPPARTLVYGSDYTLKIDQTDGGSRCAILYKIAGYWERPFVRQQGLLTPFRGPDTGSYKVTYTAGYTSDNLPGILRMAVNALVAKFRWFFPLGLAMTADTYVDRSIAANDDIRVYFISVLRPMLLPLFNWGMGGGSNS